MRKDLFITLGCGQALGMEFLQAVPLGYGGRLETLRVFLRPR